MATLADQRRRDLARLHCLKAELGLTDEEHRDVLWTLERVRSAADLDHAGRARVIAHYGARVRALGATPSKRPLPAEWAWIAGHREEKTLRALMRACQRAGLAPGSQVAYLEGCLEQRLGRQAEASLRMTSWRDFKFLFAALKAQEGRRA
jgi:hypothetical protein